jgi:hypothetical protein
MKNLITLRPVLRVGTVRSSEHNHATIGANGTNPALRSCVEVRIVQGRGPISPEYLLRVGMTHDDPRHHRSACKSHLLVFPTRLWCMGRKRHGGGST